MSVLDEINGRVAYYAEIWKRKPSQTLQHIETLMTFGGNVKSIATPLVTCKDCKHATMSTTGCCKYCDKLGANEDGELDSLVNFDGDFFCGFAERKEGR